MVSNRSARFVALSLTLVALASAAACAPSGPDPDSEQLEGADEDAASSDQGLSGAFPVGTVLITTAGLNLRSGPSTSNSVRHVVPEGARVIVQQSSPSNGFYKVKHNGTLGWNHGGYLEVDPESANEEQSGDEGGDDSADDGGNQGSTRAAAMNRAKASEGFSYWWGHGRFRDSGATSSTRGSCSGSCPSCSHSGQYGGDCSGLAAKVWQVPSSNTTLSEDEHPYSTADFISTSSSSWSRVDRDDLRQADMLVYREGGAGHIFVYDRGDGWGSMYAYECKGCASGCVSGFRTASSAYKGIRRAGW